jgi:hypothetical protein
MQNAETVRQTLEFVINNCEDCPFLRRCFIPNFIGAETNGVRWVCDADYRLIKDITWYWGKGFEVPAENIPAIPDWCPLDGICKDLGIYVKNRYGENSL